MLYHFFEQQTEKTWVRALEMSQGVKHERKGLEGFTQGMK